jgi:tetratricopeptide (TPR) repeat protein
MAFAARWRKTVVAAGTMAVLLGGCATPLDVQVTRAEWFEARIENFRVVSDLGRERTERVADRLAVFERLVHRITKAPALDPSLPILVLALSTAMFLPYAPLGDVQGVGNSSARGHLLMARDYVNRELEPVLYGEYGQLALLHDPRLAYPFWYSTGHGEMLSAARIDAEGASFGGSIGGRAQILMSLGFMPTARLFAVRSSRELATRQRQTFYAQAWLTVLYLSYAGSLAPQAGLPDRSGQLAVFLEQIHAGASPEEAAQRAFGASLERLDAELQRFLVRGSTAEQRIARSALGPLAPVRVQPLPAQAAAEVLAEAALAREQTLQAARLYERALELGPEQPALLLGLARSRVPQQPDAELDALAERGLALAPEDPRAQLDAAEYWLARVPGAATAEQASVLRERALDLLEHSAMHPAALPQVHVLLARARESSGAPPEQVLEPLRRAQALLPWDADVALTLARRLIQAGQATEARQIARRALGSVRDAALAKDLEALLQAIAANGAAPDSVQNRP